MSTIRITLEHSELPDDNNNNDMSWTARVETRDISSYGETAHKALANLIELIADTDINDLVCARS